MVYFSNLNYTKSESDARYAKLGAANVFAGQNTFNQRITSYRGFQTSNGNADILSMNDNAEKKANIVYKQTTTGYKNWCHMQYLWTANDTNYTNLLTFTFKPDTTVNEVDITTDLGSFSFNNKEIKGVSSPTTNTSVANKQYVDNIVKYVEKRGGLTFTRQQLNTTSGNEVTKYYANVNYSAIPIPNGKHIISCYSKSIPASGAHLVITFFPVYNTNQCLIEIYQYNSATDITSQLNGATYCFTYLNI